MNPIIIEIICFNILLNRLGVKPTQVTWVLANNGEYGVSIKDGSKVANIHIGNTNRHTMIDLGKELKETLDKYIEDNDYPMIQIEETYRMITPEQIASIIRICHNNGISLTASPLN